MSIIAMACGAVGCLQIAGADLDDLHLRDGAAAGQAGAAGAGVASSRDAGPDEKDNVINNVDAQPTDPGTRPEPRPEGGGPIPAKKDGGLSGGFVGAGPPRVRRGAVQVRGNVVSNVPSAGTTADGITIEGRFQ